MEENQNLKKNNYQWKKNPLNFQNKIGIKTNQWTQTCLSNRINIDKINHT